MSGERVIVTVDEAHLGGIDAVVEELRARGLDVDRVLRGVGMVTGTIADVGVAAALRGADGVSSVDLDRRIEVHPPESDVQ